VAGCSSYLPHSRAAVLYRSAAGLYKTERHHRLQILKRRRCWRGARCLRCLNVIWTSARAFFRLYALRRRAYCNIFSGGGAIFSFRILITGLEYVRSATGGWTWTAAFMRVALFFGSPWWCLYLSFARRSGDAASLPPRSSRYAGIAAAATWRHQHPSQRTSLSISAAPARAAEEICGRAGENRKSDVRLNEAKGWSGRMQQASFFSSDIWRGRTSLLSRYGRRGSGGRGKADVSCPELLCGSRHDAPGVQVLPGLTCVMLQLPLCLAFSPCTLLHCTLHLSCLTPQVPCPGLRSLYVACYWPPGGRWRVARFRRGEQATVSLPSPGLYSSNIMDMDGDIRSPQSTVGRRVDIRRGTPPACG